MKACVRIATAAAMLAFAQGCSDHDGDAAPEPPTFPPEPVATITAGTYSDTISSADPLWQGGYARAYAIYLTMGPTVAIETDRPTSGKEIRDTVVYLIGPSGVEVAHDDSEGSGLYSFLVTTIGTTGYHRIVVRGFTTYDVGGYQLSVAIY